MKVILLAYRGIWTYYHHRCISGLFLWTSRRHNTHVIIDSYFEDHYFHSIQINDRYGGYIATKHLLDKGHRRIGIFTGCIKEGGVVKKRYDGYVDALKEYGLPVKQTDIFEGTVDFDSGLKLAKNLLDKKSDITAVFCIADILAIGAMKELHNRGVRIPEDISIMGFDDLVKSRYARRV